MLSYVESFHHAQRSFLNKRQREAALLCLVDDALLSKMSTRTQACRCIRTTG
ncbi:hypothetical protein L208DRAFT_1415235, partial [Tricholoma matsutake]